MAGGWGWRVEKFIGYSVDEAHGGVFPYELSDGQSRVFDGIVTEPGGKSTSAYLYEHVSPESGPTDNQWTGTRLDFKQMLTGKAGSETTCDMNRDYEWQPFAPNPDDQCTLGQKLELKRRRLCKNQPCWNSLRFSQETREPKKCQCTEFDFKCAYGFIRQKVWDNPKAECVRDMAAPCQLGKVIPYQKIAHDVCSGNGDGNNSTRVSRPSTKFLAVGNVVLSVPLRSVEFSSLLRSYTNIVRMCSNSEL